MLAQPVVKPDYPHETFYPGAQFNGLHSVWDVTLTNFFFCHLLFQGLDSVIADTENNNRARSNPAHQLFCNLLGSGGKMKAERTQKEPMFKAACLQLPYSTIIATISSMIKDSLYWVLTMDETLCSALHSTGLLNSQEAGSIGVPFYTRSDKRCGVCAPCAQSQSQRSQR